MTELQSCPECGRNYRADKLKECPGCGHHDDLYSEVSSSAYESSESGSYDDGFLPKFERQLKFSGNQSFFAVLFNYRFEDFIFVRVARVLYLWILILSALALTYFEIALVVNFFNGWNSANAYGDLSFYLQLNFWPFIGLLIGFPILYLFEVIALRLVLEAGVALIKIAENTSKDG